MLERFSSSSANDKAVIKLQHTRFITFDSLVIDARGTGTQGVGVHLLNNADSNTFKRCTIITDTSSTSNAYAGVVINASAGNILGTGAALCDGNLFDHNTIIGGYAGIVALANTSSVMSNNLFTNNIIKEFYNYGIYLGSGNFNTLVQGNRTTRPARSTGASSIYGIYVKGAGSASIMISKNRVYDLLGGMPSSTNTSYGIMHDDADATTGNDHQVINNLIFKFSGSGPVYGLANTGSQFIKYLYNTVAIENLGRNPAGLSRGFSQTGASTGTVFKNNMVTIDRDGTGAKHVIYLATQADVESDFNNLFIGSTGGTANYLGFNGSNRLDLGAWQNNTTPPQDANSLSYDPGYVNPAIEDYRPVVAPLDNKATPIATITDDINGVGRSATPDMGAFEFTVPPCSAPTATTATVTPNTGICADVPITLDVPGSVSAAGLTYVWQSGASATGPWVNISDTLYFPKFNTLSRPDSFYRVQIICSGTVYYSTVATVNLNRLLVGGTYTIDSSRVTDYVGLPGANFRNYTDAVNAMNCGITGPIIFNVYDWTWLEQVFIHKIPGLGIINPSGVRNTVIFQSLNGNPANSILTFSPTVGTANYTLKIDSAKYVTFKNIGIKNTSTTFGRVVDISGTSGFNTLDGCNITGPAVTNAANTFAAVYSSGVSNLTIVNNTVSNGSAGIYLTGTSVANSNTNIVVQGNTVSAAYNYGIYTANTKRIKVTNNTVSVSSPTAATSYGIYLLECDTAYRILGNTVNISNVTSGTVNGLDAEKCNSPVSDSGIVASNRVIGGSGNTSNIFGLVMNASTGVYVINNTVAISSAGTNASGLQSLNADDVSYYNNSVNMTVPTITTSFAANFNHSTTTTNVKIKNNIFSNKGAGRAILINNPTLFTSDYNDLYTGGTSLVQVTTPAGNFSNIAALSAAYNWETHSIVFPPAFVTDLDLHPNLTNPDVWAIHGRGTQVRENSYDFNNNPRPTTLAAGVPDLGAYEFHPTVDPTVLIGTPVTPAQGATQVFMYGSDTVMKIKWDSFAVVPPTISVKRFSGDAPPGLPNTYDSMYFYTKVDVPTGTYKFNIDQFYIDPWQGTIPDQYRIGLGRTLPSNAWIVDFISNVDVSKKVITKLNLDYLDKFTGLVNPYAPVQGPDIDSSNRGKRFWVGYPINELDGGQDMVLYLSAQEAANVQVKINGTTWVRNYYVPANTVRVSDIIPKAGAQSAYFDQPGSVDRGISITSDVPIVAYSHIYGSASSGAGMLMPVGVWGYEYQTLGIKNLWGTDAFCYYYVIADNDNTTVEITSVTGEPLQNTAMTPGTAYTVTLNKGEWYQVIAETENGDLTGSVVKSVANAAGKCYPIAVFSGGSRTAIGCPPTADGSGDFIMQQVFPYQAWGKRYITTPSSASTTANSLQPNIIRVTVRDPSTIVKRNGTTLTGIVNNNYYSYVSSTADYIEADKPVMVAQFLTDACTGNGDPEMIYISPIEQGIKQVGFYRNTVEDIDVNYLTMVVPTNGVANTKVYEGPSITPVTNPWTYQYPHPQNGQGFFRGVSYTILVRRWTSAQQQVRVTSDSAFTAITYGQGVVESYGYNAGTLVKNLKATVNSDPDPSDTVVVNYTCANTPFSISIYLPVVPDSMTLEFSQVPATPNTDVTMIAPVPSDTITTATGDVYYVFTLAQQYTFPAPNVYGVPIRYSHPSIESCNKTRNDVIYIQVLPEPRPAFTVTSPVCEGDTTFFNTDSLTENGLKINKWTWAFHDGTTVTNILNPYKIYPAGTYKDTLKIRTAEGCIGDTTRDVIVTVRPTVDVIQDNITVCFDSAATFVVLNPIPGATYNWYDSATGVVPIATGDTLVVPHVTGTVNYYVEVIYGCVGAQRKQVNAQVLPGLPKPLPVVQSIGASDITWTWPAITGATAYEVSIDNGASWNPPSSGATGTTHTASGLAPQQSVCLIVRVLGTTACETNVSDPVCGQVGCPVVTIQVVKSADSICANQPVTLTASSTPTGYTFNWYDAVTGGTLLFTGDVYVPSPASNLTVYVEGVSGGCITGRTAVTVTVMNVLTAPVFSAAPTVTSSSVTFSWSAVTGAVAYEVEESTNPGVWIPIGNVLNYTINGLAPQQTVTLRVRAVGNLACQLGPDASQSGTTICNGFNIQVVADTVRGCVGVQVNLEVLNPSSSAVYTWYDAAVGGNILGTGSPLSVTVGSTQQSYYVEGVVGTCPPSPRVQVVVDPLLPLAVPTVIDIDSTLTTLTFTWTNVNAPGGYQVSVNSGTPINVGNVTTYTITGLNPCTPVTFVVTALGLQSCQNSSSASVTGTTVCCVALPAPAAVNFTDSSSNFATFAWTPVSGATGYKVEVQTGNPPGAWTTVATNYQGTSISIPGLSPTDSVRIRVTALGTLPCETSITATIGRGRAALDQVYIPNAFTPNGSGNPENERLRVYSNIIKEGRFMIFNQWGEKVFEANTIADMKSGWDGTFKGKAQPVGVYIFVGKFTLTNGSVIEKKGSINLVR